MSDKSRKDEQSIEDAMREWQNELQRRAMNLAQNAYERVRGVDPKNVIDGHFVEHPAVPSQDDIDQATLRDIETRLDRGEHITQEIYRAMDQIYYRHKPG
jgi:hypothetical protein